MNQEIRNRSGERLAYTWTPGDDDDCVVVIGHGLTSQHDRPWLIAVSEALHAAGIASLRFAFAGNGESEGEFSRATITKEVEDLGCVLDALGDRRIAYAGHSMGGAVGTLRTADDPRIRAFSFYRRLGWKPIGEMVGEDEVLTLTHDEFRHHVDYL